MLLLPLNAPLPTLAALLTAFFCWRNPERRVLALLLGCALVVDTVFCGGSGVDINGSFGSMLAMALLCAVFWAEFSRLPMGASSARSPLVAASIFFLWLAIPMIRLGNAWSNDVFEADREAASRFAVEVTYLRAQPGPALCESLLRCAYAGKPYLYDPFNATRFIGAGKLDSSVIVDALREHQYGAVQMYNDVQIKLADHEPQMSFTIPILNAIDQYYRPGLENEDGTIYLPRSEELPKEAAEH
jgi:hypothetical protein